VVHGRNYNRQPATCRLNQIYGKLDASPNPCRRFNNALSLSLSLSLERCHAQFRCFAADVALFSIVQNVTNVPVPRSYAFNSNTAVSGIAKKIKRTVFTVVAARAAITIDYCVPLLHREKKSRCIRLLALFADRFKWTLLATFPIRDTSVVLGLLSLLKKYRDVIAHG